MSLNVIIKQYSSGILQGKIAGYKDFLKQVGEYLRYNAGTQIDPGELILLEQKLNQIYSQLAQGGKFPNDDVEELFMDLCSSSSNLAHTVKKEREDERYFKQIRQLGKNLMIAAGKLSVIIGIATTTSALPINFWN